MQANWLSGTFERRRKLLRWLGNISCAVIDHLKSDGHDTVAAEQLLSVLLEALALHEEHYEFLQHELAREASGGRRPTSSFEIALRDAIGWLLGRTHHPL
jgi:hypothetical protein